MNPINGLKAQVSIDGLSLSCSPQAGGGFLKKTIGDYYRIREFKRIAEKNKHSTKRDRRWKTITGVSFTSTKHPEIF